MGLEQKPRRFTPEDDERLRRAVAAARIWRDKTTDPRARKNARVRFTRALNDLGLDPIERVQCHVSVVAVADYENSQQSEGSA